MLVLALDTTTRAGSAAVVRDAIVLLELAGDPSQTHGRRLPGDLMRVLAETGLTLDAVDRFAVAAGPGSFTGLRVGIATMQGLAMASGRRIVPVSALEALARAAAEGGGHAAAWMDAQRGEVFAALYAPDGHTLLIEPSASAPAETIARWKPRLPAGPLTFIGDGALRYRGMIAGLLGDRATVVDRVPALAGVVGRIASEDRARAVVPHAVVPIYIRRPDAELARARRGGTATKDIER
jgi:tRNA threonylcarbamoyladenosine biosynthesis protein TsaB